MNMLLSKAGFGEKSYLTYSRTAIDFSQLWPKIMRYYKALSVPILFALISMITALVIWISKLIKKNKSRSVQTNVVWLLTAWWILDMAFVWISPRSYEQYYLPLCGSAAVLSGFGIWVWSQKLKAASFKIPWLVGGGGVLVVLGCLSIPIFIGQRYSPDTGSDYIKLYKHRSRGFAQSLETVKTQTKAPWQNIGDYIGQHSSEDDLMYVWGWVPGIYVQAERLSPASRSSFSDMHITPAWRLKQIALQLVREFEQHPPRYIVDSRKRHIPWNRPPLELWPIVPKGLFGNETAHYLRKNPQEIAAFDAFYTRMLREKVNAEEAERYEAMKPLRDYVMSHYMPVSRREFGNHGLYERIESRPTQKR